MTDDRYTSDGDEPKGAKLTLDLAVDDEKIRQIQDCLKKGRLTITLDSSKLTDATRAAGVYIYD